MSTKHAKHMSKQERRELTHAEVELMKTLPLRFEFDKVTLHPSFMAHLNELRREGYLCMSWCSTDGGCCYARIRSSKEIAPKEKPLGPHHARPRGVAFHLPKRRGRRVPAYSGCIA